MRTLLLLLALLPVAAGDPVTLEVRLDEQSACRTLDDRFYLAFVLRTTIEPASGTPVVVAPDAVVVSRVVVDDVPERPFVGVGLAEGPMDVPEERRATLEPGHTAGRFVTAWLPLSNDPADWPGALLPGSYTVSFEVQVPVVDEGQATAVRVTTPPARVVVPDPSSVQECPFDGEPGRGLLLRKIAP